MDYRLTSLTRKDKIILLGILVFIIINNFSNMIKIIEQIIIATDNEVLFRVSSAVLPSSIALFAFLGYIITEKTKNLVNFILKYVPRNDQAFKFCSYIKIFDPEIIFNFIPYSYIKTLRIEGMSGQDSEEGNEEGEKKRFEIAHNRLKQINYYFRYFVGFTVLLFFSSLFVLFLTYILPDTNFIAAIARFIFLIGLLFLSAESLWYAFQVIQKLFLGNKDDEKIIKENFPEVFKE